jgi:hypothetical protein
VIYQDKSGLSDVVTQLFTATKIGLFDPPSTSYTPGREQVFLLINPGS